MGHYTFVILYCLMPGVLATVMGTGAWDHRINDKGIHVVMFILGLLFLYIGIRLW